MTQTPPTVCYYVSGHGLGHAARAVQVMARMPGHWRLIVKTRAPEEFVRREAGRPLEFFTESFDFGVHQDSNFAVNWERTVVEASRVQGEAEVRAEREARFLAENRVSVVVCDVPAAPLAIARRAGIPAVAIVNFTWVDVFAARARHDPAARTLRRKWRDDYACATATLRTPLSFPMDYMPNMRDIPLIAERGHAASCARLRRELGLRPQDRVVLLYFGVWGDDEIDYDRVAACLPGVTLAAFTRMPAPVRTLRADEWSFADAVAACNAVVAKPGYGTLSACMANATSVVYIPRPGFSEYRVLRDGIEAWGGAAKLSHRDLHAGRWAQAIDRAFSLSPPYADASGAAAAVKAIEKLASA